MYEVLIERSAERHLKSLPTPLFHRIVSRIRALAEAVGRIPFRSVNSLNGAKRFERLER